MQYSITIDLYLDDTLLNRIDVAATDKKADAARMFGQLALLAEVTLLLLTKKEERA